MSQEVDLITAIIGIILALITTFCFNLAIVFQKKGLKEGPEINIEKGLKDVIQTFKKLFKNRYWLYGTLLGIIGWFPYIISIGLVGIIVTEPVMATGFIFFVIAANRILGEKVGIIEYMAIFLLAVSPVLILFAGISDVAFDFHNFVPALLILLVITISLSLLCFALAKKEKGKSAEGLLTMFGGAILFALGGVSTNILAQAIIQSNQGFPWYFIFELPFGVFWFDYMIMWICIGFWMMAIFNLSSVPFYQGGFQKGKVLIMYPILDSIALLLPIFAGLFVFKQTFANYYLFWTAVVFIMIGTVILSKYHLAIATMAPQNKKETNIESKT